MKWSTHLQMLRGVAASLVFIVHFTLIERKVGGHAGLTGEWGWLGAISVDLFFTISGYIMVAITRGRFGIARETPRFVMERIGRVYPTYWLFSLMLLGVYLVKPGLINSAQGNQVNLIASFLLLPQHLLPLLAVGWTLVHEVYFYAVFACLLAWLPEHRLPRALGVWALVVVLLERLFANQGSAWIDLVSNPLTLEFIAGASVALLAGRLPRRAGPAALGLGAMWFVAALALQPFDLEHLFFHPWTRVFVCAVPCALTVLGAILLDRDGRPSRVKAAVCWLGDRSYSFYLTHVLVLSLLGKVWAMLAPVGLWGNALAFCVGYGLCLLIAATSFRWFELPMTRRIKRAVEERLPRPASQSSLFASDLRKQA